MTILITYFLLFYSSTTTIYIIYLKTWPCKSVIMFAMFLLGAVRQFCYKFYEFCNNTIFKKKKYSSVVQPFMQKQHEENTSPV
jgi:hypothetical protein